MYNKNNNIRIVNFNNETSVGSITIIKGIRCDSDDDVQYIETIPVYYIGAHYFENKTFGQLEGMSVSNMQCIQTILILLARTYLFICSLRNKK